MKHLAVIPARSGSKGLPDKNIRLLGGLPLLAHSIICAQKAALFDEIFVSTDSSTYGDIALQYGASVPFLRAPQLATDTASTLDVMRDTLAQYRAMGRDFDTLAILQPTSPLRLPADLQGAFRLFKEKNANAVVSVCKPAHSPLWCGQLPDDLSLDRFLSDKVKTMPRQKMPAFYQVNGAVYIIRSAYIEESSDLYAPGCFAYIMPKERSLDIDDELDFWMAEAIFDHLNSR